MCAPQGYDTAIGEPPSGSDCLTVRLCPEIQVYEEENTLACHNLTMVAAQLLVCGAVDAGLLFGLLEHFTTR